MNMALNGHPRSNEDEGPPDMTEDLATTNADPMSRLQQPSGRNRAGVVRYVFPRAQFDICSTFWTGRGTPTKVITTISSLRPTKTNAGSGAPWF